MAERRPYTQGTSPNLAPYEGTFSEEEIHDILSGINHDGHETSSQNHSVGEVSNRGVSALCGDGIDSETKAAARSERKRSREKQRRSDVNKHFADLTALLRKIENEGEEGGARMRQSSTPPTNRVDLLNRTISVLEVIHQENKAKKAEIADLKKNLDEANKMAEDTAARLKEATLYQHTGMQKQLMMMVPMMMTQPDGMRNNAPAAYSTQHPMMMPHQMVMVPQAPQQAPAQAPNNILPMMAVQPQTTPVAPVMYAQSPPVASAPHTDLSNPPQQQANPNQQDAQNAQNQEARRQTHQGQRKDDQGNSQSTAGGNLAHCA